MGAVPEKTGVIESSPGQKSSTRVMCLMIVATLCVVYAYCAHAGTPPPDIPQSWLVGLAGAIGFPTINTLGDAKASAMKAFAGDRG